MTVRIIAYGKPITQGSKRPVRNKYTGHIHMIESSKNAKPWRDRVHEAALDAMDGAPRIEVAVRVSLTFYFDRGAGHFGSGKYAQTIKPSAPAFPITRSSGDIDKLQRSIFDSLTSAGVWKDDSQVAEVHAEKAWCYPGRPTPCVVIDVDEIDAPVAATIPVELGAQERLI